MTPATPENERLLEVLSAHIASNNRVADAIDRFEKDFPTAAERILTEHRSSIAAIPPPRVILPESQLPTVQRAIVIRQHLWGTMLFLLILLLGCFLILQR